MKISTRGRYAVRVMLDLAEQDNEAYIPLADIAAYFYGLVEILARIYAVYLLQYIFVDYNACHL